MLIQWPEKYLTRTHILRKKHTYVCVLIVTFLSNASYVTVIIRMEIHFSFTTTIFIRQLLHVDVVSIDNVSLLIEEYIMLEERRYYIKYILIYNQYRW